MNTTPHRKYCTEADRLSPELLQWIEKENLWNLWVPKAHCGLEADLITGLRQLQALAQIDGSLGWTVTLCSGANYFIGNMLPQTATKIFNCNTSPILGGSGGAFGVAEKNEKGYKLSGKWHYATGAPYLTHFTLNAKVTEAGKVCKDKNGKARVLSFVIPASAVKLIPNWNTMGLLATATYSFSVDAYQVEPAHTFRYNHYHLSHPIFKIPFPVFADLTLLVNYIGMATHYLNASEKEVPHSRLNQLSAILERADKETEEFAYKTMQKIAHKSALSTEFQNEIHDWGVKTVQQLTQTIIEIHPILGLKASRKSHPLNRIFRDYFTATQHYIFANR